MTLTSKKNFKDQGFTLVELLIVIVVIGILALITMVAYNGIQNRARTTKDDSIAREVANKAEAYAADNNGTYPTVAQLQACTTSQVCGLSAAANGAIQSAAPAAGKVQYLLCGTGAGFKVSGYDYQAKAAGTVRTGGDTTGTCV